MMTRLTIHNFFNTCQGFKRSNKSTLFPYYDLFNLKQRSRLFVHNVRAKSIADLQVSQEDINKFLKHLVDAHTTGESTQFQEILNHKPVKKLINEKIIILENIKNLTQLAEEDQELKKLAAEEKLTNENRLSDINNDLINLVLENLNKENYNDVILEISAGVGGTESMIFVKDLLEMYLKHLAYLGYTSQIIELDKISHSGIRHVSIMISGEDCFRKLQHEAGVHRVQRVPATEKNGRVHTSVASVTVVPQASEIEVVINPKDLRIDTMRASGAGGQHVNTTDSAVRITHLPSGIVVENQTDRSQTINREMAMIKLRTKLYNQSLEKDRNSSNFIRKQQKGTGDRNEKIRTYNFNQDRVTDHRLSDATFHNLKSFMSGGKTLDDLHARVEQQSRFKLLSEILKCL